MKGIVTRGWRGLAVALLWVAFAPSAQAAGEPLQPVLDCMRANVPQTLQIKEVELTAVDRTGGTRVLKGRLYGSREKERVRSMVKINAPVDLAGASYLLRERESGDEMYVFVPALNKVRRMTGASLDGTLWGTDLSYGDVKQLSNAFSSGQVAYEKADKLGVRPVHVLLTRSTPEQPSRFDQVRSWVDAKTCVVLQAEFLEKGAVRKRLSVEPKAVKQSGTHWYASSALMSDLQQNTRTILKVVGVSSGVDLADRYFNPKTFYIGN